MPQPDAPDLFLPDLSASQVSAPELALVRGASAPPRSLWGPGLLALAGAGLVLAALWQGLRPPEGAGAAFAAHDLALTGTLGALGLGALGWALGPLRRRLTRRARIAHASALFAADPAPVMGTDIEGRLLWSNSAAGLGRGPDPLAHLGLFVADPRGLFERLCSRARAEGMARELLGAGPGAPCVRVSQIAGGGLLWRFSALVPDGAPSGAVGHLIADARGRIRHANPQAQALLAQRGAGMPATLEALFEGTALPLGEGLHAFALAGPAALCGLAQPPRAEDGTRAFLLWEGPGRQNGAAPDDSALFEGLPVALVQLGPEGRIARINRRARALLQLEGPGAALREHLEGPGRPLDDWLAAARAATPGTPLRPEVLRVIRDDRDLYVQVGLGPIEGHGEAGAGLMAVMQDVTAFKTLETQVVQSQKMQAIGQLAGGIAHDFNNLLTAINGHCDLLLLKRDAFDPDFADITQIAQNANRASSLVGQLLAFSRKQTLRPEVLDLRDTLSDVTHLLNRLVGENLRLTLVHAPDQPTIRADKRAFEQVIVNLVVNARDAMPEGGEIRVETAIRHLERAEQHGRATLVPGSYAVVRVRDHGVGIPPELADKIFEPFYSTKRPGEGTGLGLSTAYGIVKQSGGFIFVQSSPGQGSCFTLYFPLAEPVEPKPALAPAPAAARPGPAAPPAVVRQANAGTVLLVEDEAPVRSFAARALGLSGFEVFEAANAEEALALLSDPGWRVDVIVTDVVMPGLDGPGWVRRALANRPDVKVLFISGYSEEAMVEQRQQIAGAQFLAKPFSLAELGSAVRALATPS